MTAKECPFKVGDVVVYRPTLKGRGTIVMTDFSVLRPGDKYKIARIVKGSYVVPEGFENAIGGGLYWTEFVKRITFVAEPTDCFSQGEWFVMAHNLDDAGDVERVAGPFPTQSEAEAEGNRLQSFTNICNSD